MGVAVGISVNRNPSDVNYEDCIVFNDDGYYFYLVPVFEELQAKTGEMIDLYDDAIFKGEHLFTLKSAIEAALNEVKSRPSEWDVLTGWAFRQDAEGREVNEEMYDRVSKDEFVSLLEKFRSLVDLAISTDELIVCLGD